MNVTICLLELPWRREATGCKCHRSIKYKSISVSKVVESFPLTVMPAVQADKISYVSFCLQIVDEVHVGQCLFLQKTFYHISSLFTPLTKSCIVMSVV